MQEAQAAAVKARKELEDVQQKLGAAASSSQVSCMAGLSVVQCSSFGIRLFCIRHHLLCEPAWGTAHPMYVPMCLSCLTKPELSAADGDCEVAEQGRGGRRGSA